MIHNKHNDFRVACFLTWKHELYRLPSLTMTQQLTVANSSFFFLFLIKKAMLM